MKLKSSVLVTLAILAGVVAGWVLEELEMLRDDPRQDPDPRRHFGVSAPSTPRTRRLPP